MATIAEGLALAMRHHQAGNLPQAEQIYRQILEVDPRNADALHLLGVLAHQVGRQDLAVSYIGQALALQPWQASFHSNLGLAYQAQGKLDEAGSCYREALRLRPDFAEVHYNLGNVLKDLGRLAEAEASYREAVRLRPALAEAHNNLGSVLQAQERRDEAEACFREALCLRPGYAGAHNNLGTVLKDRVRLEEAEACFREALRLQPALAEAHNNLGSVLQAQERRDEAEACFHEALRLCPGSAEAHNNLGAALKDRGRLDEAEACFREALRLRPGYAEAHNNLGTVLKDQGLLEEALGAFRRVLELRPDSAPYHSNLLYTLHFHPGYDARALGEEHRRWNGRHAEPLARLMRAHANDPNPDRRLRIGYVSPDFRHQVVGLFLLPLLEAHDHGNFEICCYASVAVPDDLTRRLRGHASRWRDVAGVTDERLAELIREDRVDILVDLTAHMAHNRLLVFARKPAPVQVTYLAYCSTTGLRAMDYRLTDPCLDPPGQAENFYAEESVWLPETYWCYRPLIEVPPAGPVPALGVGHVTFGCLNNFCKATPPALAAWRDLLRAVPGARLLLHAHPGAHRDRVRAFFTQGGLDPQQVEFVGHAPLAEYLRVYDRIDVGLDPFPYAGGTTTCDALWMGVPVVSLAGKTAVGRAGLSILSNAGLSELVAHTPAEYVRLAADLAGDLPRLVNLRAGLRERMQRSALTDAPRFARYVEAAFRTMWRRWCERRSQA